MRAAILFISAVGAVGGGSAAADAMGALREQLVEWGRQLRFYCTEHDTRAANVFLLAAVLLLTADFLRHPATALGLVPARDAAFAAASASEPTMRPPGASGSRRPRRAASPSKGSPSARRRGSSPGKGAAAASGDAFEASETMRMQGLS